MSEQQTFEAWCILDLFGHVRLAGRVSESSIGGCSFIRVDVPECDGEAGYTRFFGNGAIYSMSPVTEEIARGFAKSNRPAPVSVYDMPRLPMTQAVLGAPRGRYDDDDDDDEGENGEGPY